MHIVQIHTVVIVLRLFKAKLKRFVVLALGGNALNKGFLEKLFTTLCNIIGT